MVFLMRVKRGTADRYENEGGGLKSAEGGKNLFIFIYLYTMLPFEYNEITKSKYQKERSSTGYKVTNIQLKQIQSYITALPGGSCFALLSY